MKLFKLTVVLWLVVFCASSVFASDNLLFNSSFELGESGWSAFRMNKRPAPGGFTNITNLTWKIDASDARGGKNSFLFMSDSDPESVKAVVCSHDFWVEEGKSYTVSFWAKASKGNASLGHEAFSAQRMVRRDANGKLLPDVDFSNCAKDAASRCAKGKVKLSTEWKRYSYTFTPEKGFTAYALWFEVGVAYAPVQLDCVQVEAGELTDYAPKSKVEAAVTTSDYLYEECKKLAGVVKAVSYTDDKALSLPITLFDAYFEKPLQEKTFNFTLKKGEVAQQHFEFESIPYGMLCVYTGLQPRTTPAGFHAKWDEQPECLNYERLRKGDESYQSAAYFVNVRKEPSKTRKGFRMGLTGTLDGHMSVGATNMYGTCDEIARMIRLSGTNVYRCWDPTLCNWRMMEPEKGEFLWEGDDKRLEVAQKAGVDVMCVIGGAFISRRKMVPLWAQKRDRSGNPEGSPMPEGTYFNSRFGSTLRYFKPQMEDWREYVSAVATRYKGKIAYYEIMNESDLYMPVDVYMEYMKAAVEEIRKADPEAKIQGICSTADKTVNPDADTMTALLKCIKLGADDYMDYITIHPYAMLDNSHPITQQEARRDHIAYLKKHNVKAKLWNGENYFVISDWMPATSFGARWEPENLARHYIIDMGEGLAGSNPTHLGCSHLTSQLHPFTNKGGWRNAHLKSYPNARFAVHSACARFLAGAEPLYTPELKAGAMAYVFKNGNRLLSSVWNARAKQKTEIDLKVPDGASIVVYDVMGNEIMKSAKPVTLPLSVRPYYIEWSGASVESVKGAFDNSLIICEYSIKVERAFVFQKGESTELSVSIKNMSGSHVRNSTVTVESAGFTSPVKLKVASLEDFTSQVFSAPVTLKDGGTQTLAITVTPDFGKKTPVSGSALIRDVVTLGTAAQEFKIDKCVIGKVENDSDLSASFTMRYDDYRIFLDLKVNDDKRGEGKGKLFNRDCIELFVDNKPFAEGKATQTMIQVKEGRFKQGKVSGVIKNRPGGYDAQIAISIGAAKYIGFDIGIDDSDSVMRKAQVVWKGTSKNYKNRDGLAILQIMRGMAARVDIRYKSLDGKNKSYRLNKNDAAGPDWTKHSFSFTPKEDGEVDLLLFSGWTKEKAGRFWVDYRDIDVEGADMEDLSLNKLKENGKPIGWRLVGRAELVKDADGNYLKSTHDEYCSARLVCQTGKRVTVTYEVRLDGAVDDK